MKGDDEMVNDDDVSEEMKFEKLCASGNCNSMPSKQKMQIKVCKLKNVFKLNINKSFEFYHTPDFSIL